MAELPTDHTEIYLTVRRMSDSQLCIRFEGGMFRTMLGKLFGLMLTPETTREQAEAPRKALPLHVRGLARPRRTER
jgi:hypothetical protein